MKEQLDFIIIGAAKSGTTTLFELLRQHPEIHIPKGKELPYFNKDDFNSQDVDSYLRTNFKNASRSKLWGTVTPQYLIGDGSKESTELIAERIHNHNPDIKLIAILRHPIERAYSHYKMYLRRGDEAKTFEKIVNEITNTTDSKDSNYYIDGSRYGMHLKNYYNLFDYNNIKITFTEKLASEPKAVFQEIEKFLNIGAKFAPRGINKKYHQGGNELHISLLQAAKLRKFKWLRKLWRKIIPQNYRNIINNKITHWNTKRDNNYIDNTSKIYVDLVRYYADDIYLLEKLINKKVPWGDW